LNLPVLLAGHIWLLIIALLLISGGVVLKQKGPRIDPREFILVLLFTLSLSAIFLLAIRIGDNSLSFFRPLFKSVFQFDNLLKQLPASAGTALTVFSIPALFLIGVSVLIRKRKQGWAAFWLTFSLALALRGRLLLSENNLSIQPFLCFLMAIAGAGISIANYNQIEKQSHNSGSVFRRWGPFFILAVALIIYLYRLPEIPTHFSDYEAGSGLAAIQITEGDPNYERVIWSFWERSYADSRASPFFVYFLAGLFQIGGVTIFTLRAAGVFWALGGLIIIYYLTRLLFGYRRATLAAFLLAFSPWYMSIARLGNYSSLTIFYTSGAFLLFFLSIRKSRIFYPILGMVLGLNSYFYLPVKIILPIIIITWIYQAIFIRKFLKEQAAGFLLLLVVYFIFSAGLSDPFEQLSAHRGGAGFIGYETKAAEFNPEVCLDHLQKNLRNLLNHFFYKNEGRYFPAPRAPLINRVVFLSAIIGIGLAFGTRKKIGSFFLLIWLALSLLPMIMNAPRVEHGVPRRGILLLPVVALLAAGGLEYIFSFPAASRKKIIRGSGLIGVGIILSLIFISNLNLYFQTPSSAAAYYPGEREFGDKIGELIRDGYQLDIIMKKHPVFAPQVIDFITYPEVTKLYAYFYSADANKKRKPLGTNPFYHYRNQADFDNIIQHWNENEPNHGLVIANSPQHRKLLDKFKKYDPEARIEEFKDNENRIILFFLRKNKSNTNNFRHF
jgi:4-amino-4-deoxy-L-arabinose transferase-like glycosyltransferase